MTPNQRRALLAGRREVRAGYAGNLESRSFRARSGNRPMIRATKTPNGRVVTGTPIAYSTPYSVTDAFGSFTETMVPGVARQVLAAKPDVRLLFDHQGLPLARTPRTMTLRDTPAGLNFTAELDPRQRVANDLLIALERGDVSQMSCGFVVARDSWNDDMSKRTILAFEKLLDISAVTYPASPTTTIELGSSTTRKHRSSIDLDRDLARLRRPPTVKGKY